MSERPRRGERVTLHEVASEREGTRYVLQHPNGHALELPMGEGDAFVWARLDGERTLEEIGAEYLDEFGSLHPDLPGLVERLLREDLLGEDAPPVALGATPLGERIAELAARLAMVRIPIPFTQPFWRAAGSVLAPLYATPIGGFALLTLFVGAMTVGLARPLALNPIPLLSWPGSSLLFVLVILLGLNLAVDLFEAMAQVAVLARAKLSPGRIGLSFDLGVPGIYIETPESVLLPVERRVRLLLAPLISAGFVAGASSILIAYGLAKRPEWLTAEALALLSKLAWVAWLRCAVHLNPLGPSPVYDALCSWWGVPRLRRQAWRFLRGGLDLDGKPGFDRREQLVLFYLGLVVIYALGIAELGINLMRRELLPIWSQSSDPSVVLVVAILLLVVVTPTLLALIGGALLLLQATLQALGQSELLETPFRLSLLFVGLALVAASPGLAGLPSHHLFQILLWPLTALLALGVVGAAARLSYAAGLGWGALGGTALLTTGLALFMWSGLEGLSIVQPELNNSFLIRSVGLGCALCVGLATISWGVLEAYRWAPGGAGSRLALGMVVLLLTATTSFGGIEHLAANLAMVAALLNVASALASRGSERWPGLLLGAAACGAWGYGLWGAGRLPSYERLDALVVGGVHLPLLSAILFGGAAWVLGAARLNQPELPDHQGALEGDGPEPVLRWLLGGLMHAVKIELGVGAAAATRRAVREHGVVPTAAGYEDLGGDELLSRRLAAAVVRTYQELADRAGDAMGESYLEGLAGRLPAAAQERLRGNGVTLLSPLAAVEAAPREERIRLLERVVHLTDFPREALGELADLIGVRAARAGAVLIRQGEVGDTFFILVRGRARVIVEDATGEERVAARLTAGDAFGEAALLRHEPRSATVYLEEDSHLLVLERETFASFLRGHRDLLEAVFNRQADLALVREVPIFAHLSGGQVTALCRRFHPRKTPQGEAVVRQGEAGDRFYLIRSGSFEVRHEASESEEVIATLTRGDYFGEIALLRDVPRTASVVAIEAGEVLELDRESFRTLLSGTVGKRLVKRTEQRLDALETSRAGNATSGGAASEAEPQPEGGAGS